MKRIGLVSLLALAWAEPGLAQLGPQVGLEPGLPAYVGRPLPSHVPPPPVTRIDPDTLPSRDLNTNVTRFGPVFRIDGGTRVGNNLFHSFATFDLAAGDTARWVHTAGNPLTLANVVNRVTGGTPSLLFGTLDSTAIPNAAFYFINPAGIVFGSTAQVDVPAAAHFSTASELRFATGPAFSVAAPDGSTLNVAAPQAFGFIGGEGAILASGLGANFLVNGGGLTLTGADVRVEDSAFSVGELLIAAAGPTGAEIGVRGGLAGPLDGRLEIVRSSLTSVPGGGQGGRVLLAAGDLLVADGSNVTSLSTGGVDAGPVRVIARNATLSNSFISSDALADANGGQVQVQVEGLLALDGSFIAGDSFGSGNGGGTDVSAAIIEMTTGSFITSNALGDGGSGLVRVTADRIFLGDGSFIASDSLGAGNALGVDVTAGELTLIDFSRISSNASGEGDSGIVFVDVAGRLSLSDGAMLSSDTLGGGTAGGVIVTAADVELSGASRITSDARGDGDSGLVAVNALGSLALAGGSSISTDSHGAGSGFGIFVSAAEAELSGGSHISSDAFGDGDAGIVRVEIGGLLSLRDGSYISSDSLGAGDGFGVAVGAGDLDLADGSSISSDALADGFSGTVFVDVAGRVTLSNGAHITSESLGAGDAGGVFVTAAEASLDGISHIDSDAFGAGNGGSVGVQIAGTLSLSDGSYISSDVAGAGNAGDVSVTAGRIDLAISSISSNTLFGSTGDAGDVVVEAGTLNMTLAQISSDAVGDGNAGRVSVTAADLTMEEGSLISSDSFGAGFAGGISVTADRGVLTTGSLLSSSALGSGNAGGVRVTGGSFSLDSSTIESDAFQTGDAGNIEIFLTDLTLTGSEITSEAGFAGNGGDILVELDGSLTLSGSRIGTDSTGSGDAGNIGVSAAEVTLDDRSILSSDAQPGSTGASGFVSVDTGSLIVRGGSLVSTTSFNPNPAGAILIEAGRLLVEGAGTEIASRNESPIGGDAGLIFIITGDATLLGGARISTNSLRGAAGDIVFVMPEDGILRLLGGAVPSVIETSSGPGRGGRILISSPLAIIADGSRILALGQSGGANVLIDTRYFIASTDRLNLVRVEGNLEFSNAIYDVSAGTVNPDLTVIDASGVLRGQCSAQRSSGRVSQLTVREIGPYAPARPPATVANPGDCL